MAEEPTNVTAALHEMRDAMVKVYDLVWDAAPGSAKPIAHDLAMGMLERAYRAVVKDLELKFDQPPY